MKTSAPTVLSVLLLTASACGLDPVTEYESDRLVEIAGEETCVALFAGQHIEAGTVCVTIDSEADSSASCGDGASGIVHVEYATSGGWTIEETHLAVGDEVSDIPANNKGNPKIGHFEHAGTHDAGTTVVGYDVPLCELGLDGADTSCDPVNAYFAAHAVVKGPDGSTETAWGNGESMTEQGSWAEMFSMDLVCKDEGDAPPVKQCETAFAVAGDGSQTCFIGADFDGDGIDDGISRWGWTNGPVSPGTSVQWPVYAAAGQCELGNGTLVGHVTIDYGLDGSATITFERVGDYGLDEEHIYIGTEALPRNGQGELTVAPGQYPLVIDLEPGTTTTSNTVDGLSGDVNVVYHAVACGHFGDDGGDTGGGDDGGEEDPLASFSDEFDGDLSAWSVHLPEAADYAVDGGALVMEPYANTQWYASDEALQIYQGITGDFAMTSLVTVTNLAGGPAAPGDPYRIGGIMVRDPDAPQVNSYHMGIGNMNTGSVVTVSKSTDDASSQIGTNAWDGTLAEMRICRVGADVQGLIRLPGEGWTIVDWHVRPDLPQTLAAGPIAYAGTAAPDLRVSADYVRFNKVHSLTDCMFD